MHGVFSRLFDCPQGPASRYGNLRLVKNGEENNLSVVETGPLPQNASNAEDPGAYRLSIQSQVRAVKPGTEVKLHVFLVGYGRLDAAKVSFFAPPLFLDENQSLVSHSLGESPSDGRLIFGVIDSPVTKSSAVILTSGGLEKDGWRAPSLVFDFPKPARGESVGVTVAETALRNPPLVYKLKTMGKVKPGSYQLELFLTYSNGFHWETNSSQCSIVVASWLERHELLAWSVGTMIALIAALIAFF